MLYEMSRPGMVYAARIHKIGCSDIVKDKKRGYTECYEWEGTFADWKIENFGDIASDSFNYDTENAEWLKEIDFQASEVVLCNCAKGM